MKWVQAADACVGRAGAAGGHHLTILHRAPAGNWGRKGVSTHDERWARLLLTVISMAAPPVKLGPEEGRAIQMQPCAQN